MEKKPIYTRWWFILIALIVLGGIIQGIIGIDEPTEAEQEVVEQPKEEKQEEPTVIEVMEEVTSVDYTAKVQRVKINDGILTVVFDWENQSDWDPAHFDLLGFVEVRQNDEILNDVSEDRRFKQIKHGYFDVYDLEYELIDDSEITIRIVSKNEYDGSEGVITIELE